jgi:transposase
MTIGIDLGDVWSHYCTLNQDGEVVDRGRFRTTPSAVEANPRELPGISHSDRKSDKVDAEKLARYARLDPKILRAISYRTVAQQEALTLIRARNLLVRLRTAAVNAVRGLAKPCGYRLPASSTLCFAKRCMEVLPPGLVQALGPVRGEATATGTDNRKGKGKDAIKEKDKSKSPLTQNDLLIETRL